MLVGHQPRSYGVGAWHAIFVYPDGKGMPFGGLYEEYREAWNLLKQESIGATKEIESKKIEGSKTIELNEIGSQKTGPTPAEENAHSLSTGM